MKPRFKRAVEAGDVEGVRISLANEMMLDPRGLSFEEMRVFAESSLPSLYEIHEGDEIDMNKDNWNESLLFSMRNALDNNFSRERLENFVEVAKFVLKDKAAFMDREKGRTHSSSHKTGKSHLSGGEFRVKPLAVGLTLGSLLIGGVGVILGKSVVTTVGLVGSMIGGGLLIKDKIR